MKLHVLSDIHLEFQRFEIPETDADVVILAGDIGVRSRGLQWAIANISHKPVIYILGNHEYYGSAHPKLVEKLKHQQAKDTNIHLLNNGSSSLTTAQDDMTKLDSGLDSVGAAKPLSIAVTWFDAIGRATQYP